MPDHRAVENIAHPANYAKAPNPTAAGFAIHKFLPLLPYIRHPNHFPYHAITYRYKDEIPGMKFRLKL